MSLGTLETIGYSEPHARERIDAFLKHPRSGLVDIRFLPYCQWDAQWSKQALLARYSSKQYIHLRCFGNVNYNRPGHPISLANPSEQLDTLVNALLRGASLMLLCACKEYEQCHRKTVYDLVMREVKQRQEKESEVRV